MITYYVLLYAIGTRMQYISYVQALTDKFVSGECYYTIYAKTLSARQHFNTFYLSTKSISFTERPPQTIEALTVVPEAFGWPRLFF